MAMFENISEFFKRFKQSDKKELLAENPILQSKDTAKDRLHVVLMQDRANVSADFLDLMREEIIEVIKKYIDIDEEAMDVRLTNSENEDGTQGAPALYANIPIISIKEEVKKEKEKAAKDNKNENIVGDMEKEPDIKENTLNDSQPEANIDEAKEQNNVKNNDDQNIIKEDSTEGINTKTSDTETVKESQQQNQQQNS